MFENLLFFLAFHSKEAHKICYRLLFPYYVTIGTDFYDRNIRMCIIFMDLIMQELEKMYIFYKEILYDFLLLLSKYSLISID